MKESETPQTVPYLHPLLRCPSETLCADLEPKFIADLPVPEVVVWAECPVREEPKPGRLAEQQS
jgi:hypothetical protein